MASRNAEGLGTLCSKICTCILPEILRLEKRGKQSFYVQDTHHYKLYI